MTIRNLNVQLIIIIIFDYIAAAAAGVANPGCNSTCGNNVTIPYPFGIGADCFYNEWFDILCHGGRPYLRRYYGQDDFGAEVVGVDISGNSPRRLTINSNMSKMHMCEDKRNWLAGNLTAESPFYFSYFNKFMLVGCGSAVFYDGRGNQSGCAAICDPRTTSANGCNGINCCERSFGLVEDLTHYYVNFSNSMIMGRNSCASAFLVHYDWYPENSSVYSDPNASLYGVSVPVELGWNIKVSMPGPGLRNNPYCYTSSAGYWYCVCPCGTEGNPYLSSGCQGIVDYDVKLHCSKSSHSRERLVMILVGATTLGTCMVIMLSYLLYKLIKRRRERRLEKKNFKRNGGLLLEEHLSSNEHIVQKIKLFTSKDLSKATDHFNDNRQLGHGGQGIVYKGMLDDGEIVAVKKVKLLDGDQQVEKSINEVIINLQIDHRNVVKLLGCCLDAEVPMLVYEYIQNGTLYNLIHGVNDDFVLTWEIRMRILLEVAEALAYLHSATSAPIYHRDIKSSNILLDEKYRAKVSDFGTSKHFAMDQTHLTTLVRGTCGYLDPEYFHSGQYTEKSDVYSFGVVVVELLTGKKPICSSALIAEEECSSNLATRFLEAMEKGDVCSILDPQVVAGANEEGLKAIARLAQRCLSWRGRNRPTMKEVVTELQGIKNSQTPSTAAKLISHEASHGEEEDTQLSGGSPMNSTTFSTTSSLSCTFPLLSDTF